MALSKWAPPTPGCLLFIKSFQSNYQHHTTHPLEEIKSTLKRHSIRITTRVLPAQKADVLAHNWQYVAGSGYQNEESLEDYCLLSKKGRVCSYFREMLDLEVLFLSREYSQFNVPISPIRIFRFQVDLIGISIIYLCVSKNR